MIKSLKLKLSLLKYLVMFLPKHVNFKIGMLHLFSKKAINFNSKKYQTKEKLKHYFLCTTSKRNYLF